MGEFTIQFGCLVAYRGNNEEVIIPDGVTSIGRKAFHFSKITSVTLPDSLTEIEQEAFLHAHLIRVKGGQNIKKIGADAFLCGTGVEKSLYLRFPISVFAKKDQRRAFYHFVHDAEQGNYEPNVYRKNQDYVRKHLLHEIEYQRICIDELQKSPKLLSEVLSGGKIPSKDMEAMIARYSNENNVEMMALLLNSRK